MKASIFFFWFLCSTIQNMIAGKNSQWKGKRVLFEFSGSVCKGGYGKKVKFCFVLSALDVQRLTLKAIEYQRFLASVK